jgi:hypothetical protein
MFIFSLIFKKIGNPRLFREAVFHKKLEKITPLKYVISGKPRIAAEPEVGKFQNWAEMKVNYHTDKENTSEDFSDNFHNIESFVQVDHSEKIMKNRLIFSICRSQRTAGGRKTFKMDKIKHI